MKIKGITNPRLDEPPMAQKWPRPVVIYLFRAEIFLMFVAIGLVVVGTVLRFKSYAPPFAVLFLVASIGSILCGAAALSLLMGMARKALERARKRRDELFVQLAAAQDQPSDTAAKLIAEIRRIDAVEDQIADWLLRARFFGLFIALRSFRRLSWPDFAVATALAAA